jgi:homoserine kinase type II
MDGLAAFLAARGIEGAAVVGALEGGEENENLLVEADGRRAVLRRYRWRAIADVEWELAVVGHLAAHGFPTPAAIGDAGWLDGRPAVVFPFVEGRHPERESLEAAEAVVRALARLHELTAGLELPAGRAGGDMWRMMRFRRELAEGAHRGHPEVGELAERIEAFREVFLAATAGVWAGLPAGVVHHDAHAGNVLFDDGGRLVALLDFDMAHAGPRVVELGSVVHCWASEPYPAWGIDWPRARRLVRAYDEAVGLDAAERAVLSYVVGLYYLADATDYVRNRLARNPAYLAVSGCSMYRRFRELTAREDWAEVVREELLG